MRTFLKCLVPSLAAVLTLAACGSSSSSETTSSAAQASTPATTPTATVSVVRSASSPTVGATVLTNAEGMTLYRLSGEQNGKFICTSSACLHVWHPVVVTGTGTPSGTVSSLGTVKRPDGTEQVTYQGMPLYTFTADQKPGEAKGQGLKDVGTWNAVTVASTAAAPAAASESSSESGTASEAPAKESSSKGGYAY
jgi:predicted lipoprotein with Yx(FWY)xxD motif